MSKYRIIAIFIACIFFSEPMLLAAIEIHEVETTFVGRALIVRKKADNIFVTAFKSEKSWEGWSNTYGIDVNYSFDDNPGKILILAVSDDVNQYATGLYYYSLNTVKIYFIDYEESPLRVKLGPIPDGMKYSRAYIISTSNKFDRIRIGKRSFSSYQPMTILP